MAHAYCYLLLLTPCKKHYDMYCIYYIYSFGNVLLLQQIDSWTMCLSYNVVCNLVKIWNWPILDDWETSLRIFAKRINLSINPVTSHTPILSYYWSINKTCEKFLFKTSIVHKSRYCFKVIPILRFFANVDHPNNVNINIH